MCRYKTAETISGVMSGYGFTSSGTVYDDEDRLTGYQRASGSVNQSCALTSVGDWSSTTVNGTAQSRTHGPTHELLTAVGYDFDNKMKLVDIDNNGSTDVNFQFDALASGFCRENRC